ncbi:MAG: SoxR reducing system RseC family protein [Clostridiales bacterium]|jgi:sigma-E factor negative regulatory protein RseC|nr:SoxR reducing system RseC family protein [Clostridiales bacterium]
MHNAGTVIKVNGGDAVVRFARSPACKNCGACIYIGDTDAQITLKNTVGAKAGDRVYVELGASSFMKANVLAYAVPAVCLVAGVWLGSLVNDIWGAVLGVAGAAAAFLLLRALESRFRRKGSFEPRITGREAPAQKANDAE